MFHNRKNSQKPRAELIGQFQHSFDDILLRRNSDDQVPPRSQHQDDIHLPPGGAFHGAKDDSGFSPLLNLEGLPEIDFSQSLNTGFTPLGLLASQHPGCYSPRSGGMGAVLHNQAGILHSPGLEKLMMTPYEGKGSFVNNPKSLGQPGSHFLSPQTVQVNPDTQQSTHAPNAFAYQDLQHGLKSESGVGSTFDMFLSDSNANLDPAANTLAAITPDTSTTSQVSTQNTISEEPFTQGERFRYHVALRASTAIVKSADEIPISYLNRGQIYNIMIMDLNPPAINSETLKYRTFIRICFDEEGQRSDPQLYWRLWKEGRGVNGARQSGEDPKAVECPIEDGHHRYMQIEQKCVDGFCVTWTVEPTDDTKFRTIPIQFNFLSTDFTLSKGVKGVPLRLCAKTESLSPQIAGNSRESEMCYCKVKLFRDHGAERKEANDRQHVQKSIGTLKQQLDDVGLKGDFGKRRRANSTSTDMKNSGPRDNLTKNFLEDKLAMNERMLTSSRTISALTLRGANEDDPDAFPVQISTDKVPPADLVKGVEGHDLVLPDQPVSEHRPKSAACFLIRSIYEPGDVFRSIYLAELTAANLLEGICAKSQIDRSSVFRILRVINDMRVEVDDETVRQLPNGQVMIFDHCASETTNAIKGQEGLGEIIIWLE